MLIVVVSIEHLTFANFIIMKIIFVNTHASIPEKREKIMCHFATKTFHQA